MRADVKLLVVAFWSALALSAAMLLIAWFGDLFHIPLLTAIICLASIRRRFEPPQWLHVGGVLIWVGGVVAVPLISLFSDGARHATVVSFLFCFLPFGMAYCLALTVYAWRHEHDLHYEGKG